MILQSYMKADENSDKVASEFLEDGIKEINIVKGKVEGMRYDGSEVNHNLDEPLLHSMYLLNDEGKTLKQIHLN